MKKTLLICILLLSFPSASFATTRDNNIRTDHDILKKACSLYSENWQGLKYHYKSSSEFLNLCHEKIDKKPLIAGLWVIRSLIPDGHAGFEIREDAVSKIYPIAFQYTREGTHLKVASAYDESLLDYVGKEVKTLNSQLPMDILNKRASEEPMSTWESSLELAARTITYFHGDMPHENSPEVLEIKFDDDSKLKLRPVELYRLFKTNRFVIGGNGNPSLWGSLELANDKDVCLSYSPDGSPLERLKVIEVDGKKWLWWHPRNLSARNDIRRVMNCWTKELNGTAGVIVDLRDTAGGDEHRTLDVAYLLGFDAPLFFKWVISDGTASVQKLGEIVGLDGFKKFRHTKEGFVHEEKITPSSAVSWLPRWKGPMIVMTNGICGSCCDILAGMLSKRKNTCLYGTSTAGRLIGSINPNSSFYLSEKVAIDVPMCELKIGNVDIGEGRPVVPNYIGSGGPEDAINKCSHKLILY